MFKLGQNTSNKLLRGILVSLLAFAVARINSTTVRMRSQFSIGSWAISALRVVTNVSEAGGMPLNDGIAKVDSDGAFRTELLKPGRGLLGSPVAWVVILVGDMGAGGYDESS